VDVDAELTMVEDDVKSVLPCAPTISLTRAPFGEPYLSGTSAQIDAIAPIVARHGVHIGWSIESLDWECTGKGTTCVTDRVLYRVDLGRRGTVLMHSTQKETADALPFLIAELRKRGLSLVTVESLVVAKYGKSSLMLTMEQKAKAK
jgi:peptidoglycan/xylan/chitin deacetylase (PgdA/CDA1 family)